PPASLTGILARATPSAHTTTMLLPRARADRHHDRLELDADVLDHRPLDPEQHLPYASQAHAATVAFTSVPALRSQNRKSTAACAAPLTLVRGGPPPPSIAPTRPPRPPSSRAQPSEALLDRRRPAALPALRPSPHPRKQHKRRFLAVSDGCWWAYCSSRVSR